MGKNNDKRQKVEDAITKLSAYEEAQVDVHGFRCVIVPLETLKAVQSILMEDYGIEEKLDV